MIKLNKRKIEWIIRWKGRGKSNKELAISQKITPRWVRHLCSEYRKTGILPEPKNPGRPKKKPISEAEIELILDTHNEHKCNALALEKVIDRKHKIHIPHNTIHMVMRNHGIAKRERNKSKRRKKWVRYERKHSLSLVHADWHVSKVIPEKHVIAFVDDASRMMLIGGEFDNEEAVNSNGLLKKTISFARPYGGIKQVITDRGSQFYVNKQGKKKESITEFQKILRENGIKDIQCRANHPQTNGKIEKWFDLYERKRLLFGSFEEFMEWYNRKWPHSSLDFHFPYEVFMRKLRPEVLIGISSPLFRW